MDLIDCETHGEQEEAFVCTHLVESLKKRKGVGFYFASEPRGDAWCNLCEEIRIKEGGSSGDWNERSEEFADISIVCGKCYDQIKAING